MNQSRLQLLHSFYCGREIPAQGLGGIVGDLLSHSFIDVYSKCGDFISILKTANAEDAADVNKDTLGRSFKFALEHSADFYDDLIAYLEVEKSIFDCFYFNKITAIIKNVCEEMPRSGKMYKLYCLCLLYEHKSSECGKHPSVLLDHHHRKPKIVDDITEGGISLILTSAKVYYSQEEDHCVNKN